MNASETQGDGEQSESKTFEVKMPKTHLCQVCGSTSDGLSNCLHVSTTVGSEIRCLSCYREFVQSKEHLEMIQQNIPIMVRVAPDAPQDN